MSLTSPPPEHPSEFSPEVLDVIAASLRDLGGHVHDPFAGRGVRLGMLCDELGLTFTGTDIDAYRGRDARVHIGDSGDPFCYPPAPFTVVTSPVYLNRISTDYVNGPTPTTKRNGRRAYGISLGRALDHRNLARTCRHAAAYYASHGRALAHWRRWAIVNVDLPMLGGWSGLLERHGYTVAEVVEARTRRYRGPANSDKRAECEVVIVAERSVER